MHIALCHDALIPPLKYGGTERILYWLGKALIRLGHSVTLVAREGSSIPGARFVPSRSGASLDELVPADVDILHLWATPGQPPRRPFVVTIEGNGQPGERFHRNTLFISRKHAENHGARDFIYNGIDPDDYPCDPASGREDILVFLAKASWKVKNLEGAVAVARAAGMRLEVMGSRDWPLGLHKLRPSLGGVRYHGMVDDVAKRGILRRARALLFPVRWHEPFGIALTEALASGCAVFGTPYGSLPEIVSPDVGVLSASEGELARRIREELPRFTPEKCRARVFQGFSHLDMARGYLGYYESVLRTGRLSPQAPEEPRTRDGFVSQDLLPWNP